jgi:DNA-binding LacI/PurR family transcriptional regulator
MDIDTFSQDAPLVAQHIYDLPRGEVASPPSIRDRNLIQSLAQGATQAETARRAGVSAKTVQRRMSEPEFRRQVLEHADRESVATAAQLASLGGRAVDVLEAELASDDYRARQLAARSLLEAGRRALSGVVAQDLWLRLAAIEDQLAAAATDRSLSWTEDDTRP